MTVAIAPGFPNSRWPPRLQFPAADAWFRESLLYFSTMALTLNEIVPWGRSYEEYRQMFALTEVDLRQRILGCADGPAAFNAGLTQRGGQVISVDPLYAFTELQIRDRIAATYDTILLQLQHSQADYVWEAIASVADLGRVRMAAMTQFLADYEAGKQAGRYRPGSLPALPFENDYFDLALVSHFLWLYSDHLSCEFHQQSLRELLRVAREVRLFPLLTLDCQLSPHLSAVTAQLLRDGFTVSRQRVDYEFQRGGNEMLVVRAA